MTSHAKIDAEHIIREHFREIDDALASALAELIDKIADGIGCTKSHDQIAEIENAVLSRMRIWAGARLGGA